MTEQTAIVARAQAAPAIIPTGEEAVQLLKQFAGWAEKGKPLPLSAAVGIHGLLQMGVMPMHIYVMGGSPYVATDGYIAHAQEIIEQRGQEWGRIVYTSELTPDELTRVGVEGAEVPKGTAVLKATYQLRQYTDHKKTNADESVEEWKTWEWADDQVGLGIATETEKNPVARQHPRRMAESRATRRCLRVLAGIRYPAAVEQAMNDVTDITIPEGQPMLAAGDDDQVQVTETWTPEGSTTEVDGVVVETTVADTPDYSEVPVEIEPEEPPKRVKKPRAKKTAAKPEVDTTTGEVAETGDGPPMPEGDPIPGDVPSELVRQVQVQLESALVTNATLAKWSFGGEKATVGIVTALRAGYTTEQIVRMVTS